MTLELRPTCEHCNKALPPDSLEARICSYECPVDPGKHAAFARSIKDIPPEKR